MRSIPASAESAPLLAIAGLGVRFTHGGVDAVRGVDLDIARGESLGLVGESGSGKSQTVLAALGLAPRGAEVRGSVRFDGTELIGARAATLNRVRGARVGFVFQDAMAALNPHLRIATQMMEVLQYHRGLRRRAALKRAEAMLDAVRIPEPGRRLRQYPHELSGGMRSRVGIAMALLCEPELLIADEPTTALDVTVQAEILSLLAELRARLGMALLLITHDLGVVAGACDRVAVMYAGRVVETAPAEALFRVPAHPYTAALLAAVPRLDAPDAGAIPGAPPEPGEVHPGCAFAPRCRRVFTPCREAVPVLKRRTAVSWVACHRESPA